MAICELFAPYQPGDALRELCKTSGVLMELA
jgi:hypothetical protein